MNTEELKLNSMKYQALQKLAKKHGVKANLPRANNFSHNHPKRN